MLSVPAFPLIVTVMLGDERLANTHLLSVCTMTLVGFGEAALFDEENKFSQAAFVFGYVISLHLLFLAWQ